MKVVICADAHLDSPFSMFHRSDVNLSIRHQEHRQAFTKAIDEVKRIGAELLLIPGDLFDGLKASVATIKFLVDAFASIQFSTNSLTTEEGLSTTSPAAILFIVKSSNIFILLLRRLLLQMYSQKVRIPQILKRRYLMKDTKKTDSVLMMNLDIQGMIGQMNLLMLVLENLWNG